MTPEEHKDRHILLHQHFDELLADFIWQTDSLPSQTTLLELINWSYQQTLEPTENARNNIQTTKEHTTKD
jgi:hypothetical protein